MHARHQRRTALDAELLKDALQVFLHGRLGAAELLRDQPVVPAQQYGARNLLLAQ